MDDLVNDIRKLIEPVHKLIDEATSYIESDVYDILSKRITDKRQIEKVLEDLLNYAGMSDKAALLFKRLCGYYFFIDPTLTSTYIIAFLEMYGAENADYNGKYDDDGLYINSIDTIKEVKTIMGNTAMTIITGDTHGDFRHIESLCVLAGTTKDDLLIIIVGKGHMYEKQ